MTHISLKVSMHDLDFLKGSTFEMWALFMSFLWKFCINCYGFHHEINQIKTKNERWFCFLFASLYINTLWTVVRISRLLSILLLIFWEDMIYKSSNKSSTNLEVIFSVERLKRGKWQKYWRKDKALCLCFLIARLYLSVYQLPHAQAQRCMLEHIYVLKYMATSTFNNYSKIG